MLRESGIDEATVAAFLSEDEAVIDALNQRADLARRLMEHVGARGVPTLLRVTETGVEAIDGRVLFENPEAVVMQVIGSQGAA